MVKHWHMLPGGVVDDWRNSRTGWIGDFGQPNLVEGVFFHGREWELADF